MKIPGIGERKRLKTEMEQFKALQRIMRGGKKQNDRKRARKKNNPKS